MELLAIAVLSRYLTSNAGIQTSIKWPPPVKKRIPGRGPGLTNKIPRIMKLTAFFLVACFLQVSAGSYSQEVSLAVKNASIEKVFRQIEKQTRFTFWADAKLLDKSKPVSVEFKNVAIADALQLIFKDQPFTYAIQGRIISVKQLPEVNAAPDRQPESPATVAAMPFFPITGRVTDIDGKPLVGANVTLKNTKRSVVTDANGSFSLNAEAGQTIIVSYVGYSPREITLTASNLSQPIVAKLEVAVNDLDETVVVAYNTTTQRANTGAVTVVKGEQIKNLPNRSFDKSLQGLVPGLLVTNGNGQPGGAPGNFILRGIATGGSPEGGSTVRNPLIVIDGIPVSQDPATATSSNFNNGSPYSNPMAQLNPSDIESISVLKDAAAIALYGSKASNGVILVTTKKGKNGKTVFSFRHQTELASQVKNNVEMLDQEEYLALLFEAYRNSYPAISDASILADLRKKFPVIVNAPGDTSFHPTPDWNKPYYRKAAVTTTNEISLSGGNERSNFYLNFEYTKQNGIVRTTGYDRKSLRFNYENRPTSWLKMGLNAALSYNIQHYANGTSFDHIQSFSPLNPIYKPDGQYFYNYLWGHYASGGSLVPNPLAVTDLNINKNTAFRGLTKLYAEGRFLKHFTITSNVGIDFMLNELKEKIHPLLAYYGSLDYKGHVYDESWRNANVITTNVLRFGKSFYKDHHINILVGQEAQILTIRKASIGVIDLTDNPSGDQAAGGKITGAGSNTSKQTLLSYFGQFNYGFRNKYFLSGSIRTDGSSQFGKNERFGSYWSIGSGWVITEEPFIKKSMPWLSYLKLRGSFGPAGNSSAIKDYLRFDRIAIQKLDYLGRKVVFPIVSQNPGNPSIQWEETFTWDAGMELQIFDSRVSLTADIYTRKTKNLIAHLIPLPAATGFSTITDNVGDIKNSGMELSVTVRVIKSNDFTWNFSANWSKNRNLFVKAFYPENYVNGLVSNKVGLEYNSYYLPVWAGVNPANGRPLWIDSVGRPNEDYNAAQKQFVGKAQPDGFGSVTNSFFWKGIELSAMVYYQYGSQIYYNGYFIQNDGFEPYGNQNKGALNRWQKPGDIALNPRRLVNGKRGSEIDIGSAPSTRYLYKGDFIRLSNIAISYQLPKSLLRKLPLQELKIFVQGHNLATWTPYAGQDPENVSALGSGYFLYPQQQSFTIGLNANF